MSNTATVITTKAGEALIAQMQAENKALVIDKFIFANVANRPMFPSRDDVVPTEHVVHESAVHEQGRLTENSVIYSTTLASNVGPFSFNWSGLFCSEHNVLVAINFPPPVDKTVDAPGITGNTLVRSFVLEYKGIAETTNIIVDPSSWQYDAHKRMSKMDNDTAQAIIDQNGKDWFIDDGFIVTPQSSAYSIKVGAGYVSGHRISLDFDRIIQVPEKPAFIYVDAFREGSPTGEWQTKFTFVVAADEKDDYTDAQGVNHFVCKIAQVLAGGSVVDCRNMNATTKMIKQFKLSLASSSGVKQIGTASGLNVDDEYQVNFNDCKVRGVINEDSSVVIIGDSITESVGASNYRQGYAWKLSRSIWNQIDKGMGEDNGYGYETIINMARAVQDVGISTTGKLIQRGVVSSQLELNDGESISITRRAISYADIFYDGSVSSGEIEFAVDGKIIAVKSVDGLGIQTTFPTALNSIGGDALKITESNVVTITAKGGILRITGLKTFKRSYNSPTVFVIGKSGWAYKDYINDVKIDEIATYSNWYRSHANKLFVLNIGTNNIYNSSQATTPLEMVSDMNKLIDGIKKRCTKARFLIAVPPKANESKWPIIKTGYSYDDYVREIVLFCVSNNYSIIRHDTTTISKGIYYSDGVHPCDDGHTVMAGTICDALGIQYNQRLKEDADADPNVLYSNHDVIQLSQFGGGHIKFVDVNYDYRRVLRVLIKNKDTDRVLPIESIQDARNGYGIYWTNLGNGFRLFYDSSKGVAPPDGILSEYINDKSINVEIIIETR